jgi:pantothenate kinase
MRRLANLESDVFIPEFDCRKDMSIVCFDVVSANDRILIVEGNYFS